MKKKRGFLRACGRGCRRTAKYLCNGLLFATLLLFGVILYAEWRDRPIRLPEPALRWIVDLTSPEDIEIAWDRVVPDANGSFRFHAFEIRQHANGEPILTIRNLRARPNWLGLLTGLGAPLESLEGGGGRLYLPGMWSGSGVPEVLLDEIAGSVHFRYRFIEIRDLRARSGPVRVRLHGRLDTSAVLPGIEDPAAPEERLRGIARDVLPWIEKVREWSPVWIDGEIQPEGNGAHGLRLSAVAEEISVEDLGTLEALYADGRIRISDTFQPNGDIRLSLRALEASGARTEGVRAAVHITETSAALRSQLRIRRLTYDQYHAEALDAALALDPDTRILALDHANIVFAGMDIQLLGEADPDSPAASTATVYARIDPATTLDTLFPENEDLERFPVTADTRSWIRARIHWPEDDWARPVARLDGEFVDFSVAHESYAHTLFEGAATLSAVAFEPVEVTDRDGQHASGAFLMDFNNTTFRILAEGALHPRRLDNYFQGDWWADLRERIDSGEKPFEADVDVVANWVEQEQTHSVVWVRGEEFTYLGHPVASGEAIIRQGPARVDLVDLKARTGDGGFFGGTLGWRLHGGTPPDYENQTLHVDIDSTLDLPALAVAFDQPWITDDFAADTPPRVRVTGEQLSKRGGEVTGASLDIGIEADTFSYREVAGEKLLMDARLRDARLDLDIRELSAFGGRVEGTVSIADRTAEEPAFQIDLDGSRLSYPELLRLLRQFTMTEEERAEAPPLPERGIVRFELNGEGVFPHVERFSGEGSVALEKADLGTIRLVGILSRILEQVGLPLASFTLNSMETRFRVADRVLHLPDLTFQGPTMRVRAEGDIALPDQRLALDLRVFPLTPEENPLVSALGIVFRPLTYALRIELSGTPENPSWRFRHSPLNVFRSTPEPIEPVEGERLLPPPVEPAGEDEEEEGE
ncbi:MAG: hypothetical protein JJU00_06965 [Opitutales bacterium]|nr:hypothetical protein [Opitutales bacterium]